MSKKTKHTTNSRRHKNPQLTITTKQEEEEEEIVDKNTTDYLTVTIRDSGIVDDETSETSSTANRASFNFIPSRQVQNRIKCFEFLAQERNEFHSNPNWWLEEQKRIEEQVRAARELKKVQTQSSVESQKSIKSLKSQNSNKSQQLDVGEETPVNEIPEITFDDAEEEVKSEEIEENFEGDEEEEEVEEVFVRNSLDRIRVSRPPSINSHASTISLPKLFNIIRELQENEQNYVKSLENGIKNYMSAMDQNELPRTLRGQKFKVFGNIFSIYKFHADEFFPNLLECGYNVEEIADLFTTYVTRDFFYSYVIYAINRKRSELLCNIHMEFWKETQNACGDRLGINSFLLQPIQRLPRYQLLLNEIIKDLSKDLDSTAKQTIAACCVAEKNIQRLLDSVNESMSLCDIRNCYEIDILCQGKFKKMNEFDMYDWELRRRFRGKVFLFEGCVIYTEELSREYLEFRGFYESDKLGIIYKEGKSKFKLFAKKRGHKEVEFYADNNTVVEWKNSITAMLMDFVAAEKKRNASNSLRKNSTIRLRAIPDSVRSSMISTTSNTSNLSNFSIGSYGSFRSSTSSGIGESIEQRQQSQWYV